MFKKTYYLAGSLLLLSACASTETPSYITEYQIVEQNDNTISPVSDEAFQRFTRLFSNLKTEQLHEYVEETYADELYFNDTLNTIRTRSEMLGYLQHTAKNLSSYKFKVVDKAQSDDNIYVRWVMEIEFTAAGKEIKSKSVGMSHLKYNKNEKIVLHQDYWDSVEGIYQHLPYIGYWVKKVREKL